MGPPCMQVAGGRTMRLRTNDPAYLAHAGRWWTMLFSKLGPLLYQRGGPIVMVQVGPKAGVNCTRAGAVPAGNGPAAKGWGRMAA